MESGFATDLVLNSRPSVEHERPDHIPGRGDQVLVTVEHVGLRRVRDPADASVPERLAIGGIVRDKVAGAVARKKKSSSGREQSASAAGTGMIRTSPGDFARLVIDRRQITPGGADVDLLLAAQAHRAPWIQVGQIEDRVLVAL